MKKVLAGVLMLGAFVAGLGMVVALTAKDAAARVVNVGAATFDCAKGVTFSFVDFPSAYGNTVNGQAQVNGQTVVSQTMKWNGRNSPPFTFPIAFPNGKVTVRATAQWNTNGAKGSFDSRSVVLDCSHGSTSPPSTVTVTVTTPAPAAPPPATVTIYTSTTQTNVTNTTATVTVKAKPRKAVPCVRVKGKTKKVASKAKPAKPIKKPARFTGSAGGGR